MYTREKRSENFRVARLKAAEFWKSEKGKERRKQIRKETFDNLENIKKNCINCKSEFDCKKGSQKKYCSNKCKSAYRRKSGKDNQEFECIQCKNKFISNKYIAALVCSKRCLKLLKNDNVDEGYIENNGYRVIYRPGHPNAQRRGKILKHVFIMSEYLGRPLAKHESVHHKNGIRDDNRIENLELWSKSQPAGQRVSDKIKWCKEFLKEYGEI